MSALSKVVLNDNKTTAQTEKADDRQSQNNAGGYSFTVTDKDRFRRFLTIGTEGGTYYVGESRLTDDSVKFIEKYIASAGVDAINEIVEVSDQGLAPKNDQAIFALAVAFRSNDLAVKEAAKAAVNKVCRTATHLFMFVGFLKNVAGMGRAKTSAIASWYEQKSNDQIAYQAVKYRQRGGFTHRDILRLAHPRGLDENVVNFMLGKEFDITEVPSIVQAFDRLQNAKTEGEVLSAIAAHDNVSWEMIPTEFHKSPEVWKALFKSGIPQMALLRNVTRMARLGLFDDMVFAADYAKALSDAKRIEKSRIHPINYLNALVTYEEGQAQRSPFGYSYFMQRQKDWKSNAKISKALNDGYKKAFKNVEPSGKRTFVALDVSGSMGAKASGIDLSCAQVSGALASFIAATEPYSMIRGFASEGSRYNFDAELVDLGISESDSFNTVMKKVQQHNFGATDCALPMKYAYDHNIEVDTFIVVTDNETYAGTGHPHEWLKKYNKKMGRNAKLVVVAATATEFTIAEPDNPNMLDVSGFDSSTPKVIADFSAGRI